MPVDDKEQCVSAAGFDHKLCMAWRQDNAGPHSAEEVCPATSLLLLLVQLPEWGWLALDPQMLTDCLWC